MSWNYVVMITEYLFQLLLDHFINDSMKQYALMKKTFKKANANEQSDSIV